MWLQDAKALITDKILKSSPEDSVVEVLIYSDLDLLTAAVEGLGTYFSVGMPDSSKIKIIPQFNSLASG